MMKGVCLCCFDIMFDRPEPITGLRLKSVSSTDYIMRDMSTY